MKDWKIIVKDWKRLEKEARIERKKRFQWHKLENFKDWQVSKYGPTNLGISTMELSQNLDLQILDLQTHAFSLWKIKK
jgi:hypothetical protein